MQVHTGTARNDGSESAVAYIGLLFMLFFIIALQVARTMQQAAQRVFNPALAAQRVLDPTLAAVFG